jgi:hypothetical protein
MAERRPSSFRSLLIVAFLLVAATPASADDTPWPAEAYNPAPAEGDVVLPMPCDGAMAFRRVALPSTGVLDDVRVQFGDAQPELGFFSDRRYDVIAGAFGDPAAPGTRYFLIGKYEVTRAQWAALSGDACPDPGMRQRVPQTEISWFDVIGFANRYSQWLLAHARDALPAESGTPGFLRLPTEDEWEYAARGGMAVSSENFLAARFPMPEGAADYIWYQGTGSAEGRLHPIGLLKPNPLGLHDILGNAAEMMLESFRLNRRGRLHGQAGGFIARGGDYNTPLSQIRSGMRVEMPYYAAGAATATESRQLGFRLVVAAPVVTSPGKLTEIEKAWEAMPSSGEAPSTARREDSALGTIDRLADQAGDETVRAQLRDAGRSIREALVDRNDARDRTVRLLINVGALLGNKLRIDHQRLLAVQRAIEGVARPALRQLQSRRQDPQIRKAIADATARIGEMEAQRDGLEDTVRTSRETYVDTVLSTGSDYSDEVIAAQLPALKAELHARGSDALLPYVDLFVRHMRRMRDNSAADPQSLIDDLTR